MALDGLPRREREVFETLCRLGSATVATVRGDLDPPLSDSAVRTLLKRLEDKGLVRRRDTSDGLCFTPAPRRETVAAGALKQLVETFFAGSAASAATALLGMAGPLSPEDAEALERLIDQAREPRS